MENISIPQLQDLANMLHEEGNLSTRNQLSAWVTAKSENADHVSLSGLAALAAQSGIKDKILVWISNVSGHKPEFVYVPDTPMEMIENPEEELNFEKIEESLPPEVEFEVPLSNIMEQGVPPAEKVKKPRKKKGED